MEPSSDSGSNRWQWPLFTADASSLSSQSSLSPPVANQGGSISLPPSPFDIESATTTGLHKSASVRYV